MLWRLHFDTFSAEGRARDDNGWPRSNQPCPFAFSMHFVYKKGRELPGLPGLGPISPREAEYVRGMTMESPRRKGQQGILFYLLSTLFHNEEFVFFIAYSEKMFASSVQWKLMMWFNENSETTDSLKPSFNMDGVNPPLPTFNLSLASFLSFFSCLQVGYDIIKGTEWPLIFSPLSQAFCQSHLCFACCHLLQPTFRFRRKCVKRIVDRFAQIQRRASFRLRCKRQYDYPMCCDCM